jgi:RNA polymerase sigma-70 factor (ECF subfamily)
VLQRSSQALAAVGTGELDERFRGPLMQFFLRRVGDRAEAEDLTQQVFLRVLRGGREEAAAALVFRTAANLLKDRNKLLRRRGPSFSIDENLDLAQLGGPAEELTPERVAVSRETLKEVLKTLDGLGPRTRDIFILFRLENMSQAEIAALFGITRSAVEKHVMKASFHLLMKHRAP